MLQQCNINNYICQMSEAYEMNQTLGIKTTHVPTSISSMSSVQWNLFKHLNGDCGIEQTHKEDE